MRLPKTMMRMTIATRMPIASLDSPPPLAAVRICPDAPTTRVDVVPASMKAMNSSACSGLATELASPLKSTTA